MPLLGGSFSIRAIRPLLTPLLLITYLARESLPGSFTPYSATVLGRVGFLMRRLWIGIAKVTDNGTPATDSPQSPLKPGGAYLPPGNRSSLRRSGGDSAPSTCFGRAGFRSMRSRRRVHRPAGRPADRVRTQDRDRLAPALTCRSGRISRESRSR